jgi:hypothetical protein
VEVQPASSYSRHVEIGFGEASARGALNRAEAGIGTKYYDQHVTIDIIAIALEVER